jgi:DNA-binding NtrC family response regulator
MCRFRDRVWQACGSAPNGKNGHYRGSLEGAMDVIDLENGIDGGDISFIVASPEMKKVVSLLPRVGASTASVLITGETGTGKELIARAVRAYSQRCHKPWVDINCAAIPEHLLESELFGYERGAFSGADAAKKGLFELADGGTILLDEVGELDPKLQVKLLRVLDGAPYYRLGGNRKVSVDVRVIAATNQPLEQLVQTGEFRRDLYHRLSQFHLKIPPLRERPEDILALADYFLSRIAPGKQFSQAAKDRLLAYRWLGNIRELESVVLQATTYREEQEISADSLPLEKDSRVESADPSLPGVTMPAARAAIAGVGAGDDAGPPQSGTHDLTTLERQAIIGALASAGGHQGMTAFELGISRRTLSRKLKLYNIDPLRSWRPNAAVGELSFEQQLRFRYSIKVPVEVVAANGENFQFETRNVSCGGICVKGAQELPKTSGTLSIRLNLPGCTAPVEATGKIVWTDREGTFGIRFVNAPRGTQLALNDWLKQKQEVEGWE